MLIGVPKEIKNNEFRVGLVPNSVSELIHAGHKVIVEAGAAAPGINTQPITRSAVFTLSSTAWRVE